jgi:hypothetical protein
MRPWVICLFVVLLPLRLWAADAMALQMVTWPQAPAQHQPCHGLAHDARHGSAHDAVAMATPSDHDQHHPHDAAHPASGLADHGSHGSHGMCLLCDVCHNALGMTPQGQVPHTQAPAHPQTALNERVASALRQPGFKPPIG